MLVKKIGIKLLAVVALLLPVVAEAQTSSVNAFSPYTMYGIGEQNTPGTLRMRSMGGVGIAAREASMVNLLNPAASSAAPRKTFLFSFGLEGQNYYNKQTVNEVEKHSAYNTFNIHDVALQMPLAKRLGLSLSLHPYSSVGYRTSYYHDLNSDLTGQVGPMLYTYQGEGDITEVKLGVGWEVFKNFSIGAAVQYYWGEIERNFVMAPTSIVGEGSYLSTVGLDQYDISSFKGQVGVQWNLIFNPKRILTLGATFDFGGDLKPTQTSLIYNANNNSTEVKNEEEQLSLVLPYQAGVGLFYRTAKWAFGVDYIYQNWGGRNKESIKTGLSGSDATDYYTVAYTNTNTIKAGVEFTPNRYDVRHLLKRWSYRLGFRYGTYNQTFNGEYLDQYAVTAGIGIPVKFFGISMIDVGVEYGLRGTNLAPKLGLVSQQYFKFGVGFSLFAGAAENNEYWFTRPKYD